MTCPPFLRKLAICQRRCSLEGAGGEDHADCYPCANGKSRIQLKRHKKHNMSCRKTKDRMRGTAECNLVLLSVAARSATDPAISGGARRDCSLVMAGTPQHTFRPPAGYLSRHPWKTSHTFARLSRPASLSDSTRGKPFALPPERHEDAYSASADVVRRPALRRHRRRNTKMAPSQQATNVPCVATVGLSNPPWMRAG